MSEENEVTTRRDLSEPSIGPADSDSLETPLPEPADAPLPETPLPEPPDAPLPETPLPEPPDAPLPETSVPEPPETTVEGDAVPPRRPPRRFRTATVVLVALLSAALATGITLLVGPHAGGGGESTSAGAELYQCPMHPTIVQDHPGDCPICGMKLVKVDQAHTPGQPAKSPGGERRILFYRSPMNPAQTSPTPRQDEMGMDYIPVYEGEDNAGPAPGLPGLATVEIDAERQQLIGLRTTEVTRGPVGGAWRTVGRVAVDETRVRHVNVKVSGFVEKVFVNYTGQTVRRGRPLFSMYSPELLAAQEEYLLALRSDAVFSGGPAPTGGARDNPLLSAARRRLELWDVPPAQIDRLARTREPTRTLTFSSPATGVVTKKDVVEGMRLEAGAMPYEIVDLSSLWVLADVYETELRFIREGMPATLTVDAYPNREFQGTVAFIEPILNPQTRTVKVRVTLPNPTGELRPEMFGEVVLQGAPHDALRIPTDAIIDSGTEKIVFVALGEGRFQPRQVTVGESDGDQIEIQTGLSDGERVVTRANFLVDSESRLRASLADMTAARSTAAPESARVLPDNGADRPAPEPEPPAGSTHGQHSGQP